MYEYMFQGFQLAIKDKLDTKLANLLNKNELVT